jgi:hypothetical protein
MRLPEFRLGQYGLKRHKQNVENENARKSSE